jgi:hypothetical protein
MNIDTEQLIKPKSQEYIAKYLKACDPIVMMSLLMEFGRTHRHDLTEEEYRQISECHNLLGVIFRNE